MYRLLLLLLLIGFSSFAQTKKTVSGYIKDASNGEALIGATVYIKELATGATTNVYGFYSVTVASGVYQAEFSYLGYQKVDKPIELAQDVRLDIELQPEAEQLQEVVITDTNESNRAQSLEMSTAKLDIKTISKIPAFLGEADVIKSIQMLPGISSVGEGSSGFNSRGGTVGQNLLLLDEAPVYNSSHMLGFFSAFNPDAVKDVKLYKGGIPAKFGGRLSSLLDIRMKEGNNKKFSTQGGIGTVFSRLALEGPIVKDKGSYIVAARRSYIDLLAAPVLGDFKLYFYDVTAKANYSFNAKNRVYLSGYLGRDVFSFGSGQGLDWGSQTGTLRWNHIFNQKLFANFTAVFSRYDYQLQFGDTSSDKFKWNSSINNFIFKPEFSYFINSNNELAFGAELTNYTFDPATTTGASGGEAFNNTTPKKYGDELAAYISHSSKINQKFSVEYGLRISTFQYRGPGFAYTFNDTIPGRRPRVVGTTEYESGKPISTYFNWEPRASVKFQLTEQSSIKASYNRMAQYIHLVSNTVASNPLDIWTPSTNNIKPQIGDQYALGYFRNFNDNKWEFSVEGYYRATQNQLDYINGADLLINEYLEGELLSGIGRAYGMEFYLQRKTGRLNGWVSYTLSRSEFKIDGINNHEWYPALFDRPHNLKMAMFYDINKRWSFSANFTYQTGTPTTSPTSKYYSQGVAIPLNAENQRNNYRLNDNHRLDIAFTLQGREFKRNGNKRKNHDYWVFSIYNVYARRNAFVVDFKQSDGRFTNQIIKTEALQTSIIGSMIPSVSYNYKF
jgi:CarboxypepD_reg-like domain/TonB-dependent Receptor Plug Domain